MEDVLFDWNITGHYRYVARALSPAAPAIMPAPGPSSVRRIR
jgi:hypothetical protein